MNTPICHAIAPSPHDEYMISDVDEFPNVWSADLHNLVQIADDKSTKSDLLTMLAAHADPLIRSAVADNPSTSDAILQQLAVDGERCRNYIFSGLIICCRNNKAE